MLRDNFQRQNKRNNFVFFFSFDSSFFIKTIQLLQCSDCGATEIACHQTPIFVRWTYCYGNGYISNIQSAHTLRNIGTKQSVYRWKNIQPALFLQWMKKKNEEEMRNRENFKNTNKSGGKKSRSETERFRSKVNWNSRVRAVEVWNGELSSHLPVFGLPLHSFSSSLLFHFFHPILVFFPFSPFSVLLWCESFTEGKLS